MTNKPLASRTQTFEHALPAGRNCFLFARSCLLVSPARQINVRLAALPLATGPNASLFVPKATEIFIDEGVSGRMPFALFLPFGEWEAQSSLMPMRIPMSAEVHHRFLLFGAGRRHGGEVANAVEWPAVVMSRQMRDSAAQFHRKMTCLHSLERRIVALACAAQPQLDSLRGLDGDVSYGRFIRAFGMTPRRYLAELSRRIALAQDVRGYQSQRCQKAESGTTPLAEQRGTPAARLPPESPAVSLISPAPGGA